MYTVRTPNSSKRDPVRRWALPDRVFFACGACHVLAHAVLERHGSDGTRAMWIRPRGGSASNHVVVDGGSWAFDHHGYSTPERLLAHLTRRTRRRWPDWSATMVALPASVLVSESASRAFDLALRLREPNQFLHDALPRARRFLNRFPAPPA